MRNLTSYSSISRSKGFSLIEVLIAVLVFSLGLMGLAAVQIASVRTNQSAAYRSAAVTLAYAMADRMRANQNGVLTGQYYTDYSAETCAGQPPDSPTAEHDIFAWKQQLACQLPDGQGEILFPGGNVQISVKWTDARWAVDPTLRDSEVVLSTTL